MADLSDKFIAGLTRIVGADSTGVETNYVNVDVNGSVKTLNVDAAGAIITTQPVSVSTKALNTSITGTFTATDAVVAAPIGDGTIVSGASTAGSIVSLVVPAGFQSWNLLIKGYVSGTIYTEASDNSTNGTDGDWIDIKGRRTGTTPGIESIGYAQVANGYYRGNVSGFTYFRARLIGATGPSITITLADSTGAVFLNSGIPTGTSVIGKVGIDQTTPGTSNAVAVTNFPASQVVTGTVTSNIGTTNGLALDATLTNGTQKASVRSATKGTSTAADVTSTNVDANTQALDVSIKGTVATTLTSGTVSANIQSAGTTIGIRPDGFVRAQIDPATLLFDTFETLDTTNTWTIGGTTAPTGANGNLTLAPGTAASATSFAKSIPVFTPGSSAYLQYAALVQLEAAAVTGNQRVWGIGVYVTPTAAVPITNGSVFEIDSVAGALFGSVYSNGVRTQTLALTRPTDGAIHRYALYYKASRVYFEIDNVAVGSIPFPNPQVSSLSTVLISANGGTIVATAPTLVLTLVGLGDTGRNATKLADGTFPWRTGKISAQGAQLMSIDQTTPGTTNLVTAVNFDTSITGSITAPDTVAGIPAANGVFTTGVPTAGSTVVSSVQGSATTWSANFTGTFGGTSIYFETSLDSTNGSDGNWTNVNARTYGVMAPTIVGGAAFPSAYTGNIGGAKYFRVRAIGGAAINVVCTIRMSIGINGLSLNTQLPNGINTIGAVASVDGLKATYSATIFNLAPATLATDVFTITGSATKTVRVTRITTSGTQTTGSNVTVVILKRSTANTAGTFTTLTGVPHNSTNPAATATVLAYTANPTVGTLVGNIRSRKVLMNAATAATDEYISEFGTRNSQAIVLNGITQVLAVNLNGVTIAGESLNITIEWTEET